MSSPTPIIEFDHWKIHTAKRFNVPIMGTNVQRLCYKVVTPANVSAHCILHISGVFAASVSGTINYAFAVTSGFANTAITPVNRRLGDSASVCTVTYDADGTFALTSPVSIANFTVAVGGGNSVGNLDNREGAEIIVPQSSTFYIAIELSAATGDSNPLTCTLDYYEES